MSKLITDANSIVGEISFLTSDFASIYPITPSSPMGELYSKFCENNKKNIFNTTPTLREMQSEAGAIACVHGASVSGSFSTTFTSSQGLLLMIPNMIKLANEMLPCSIQVASRSLSSHALNIFCDHSDVMQTRQTGFSMLCSSSVQEAQDFCLISNILTLKTRIPVLHFFDGFRTSHEINTIEKITKENIINLFPFKDYYAFKNESLTNINPQVLGTNQNSDIFFQARERIDEAIKKIPDVLNQTFSEFYKETSRCYSIFEYFGSKSAKYVLVLMGSSTQTAKKFVENMKNNDYGVIKVNLFNPFIKEDFLKVLPKSTKVLTVLDRTKENGSLYEPLCLNVLGAVSGLKIKVLGGRYGLGGKEFTLDMVNACFENMKNEQKDHFTVGIDDDINFSSLKVEEKINLEKDDFYAIFYGLGSDGMVTASKNTLKIVGNNTNFNVFGYFNYDSKKSLSLTSNEIIISKEKINHSYPIIKAHIIVVNNIEFLNHFHKENTVLKNGTIIINSKENLNEILNDEVKFNISQNNIKIYQIDANILAIKYNLGTKINLIMQSAFFNLTNFLDYQTALNLIKLEAQKSFSNKNSQLVENSISACNEVESNLKRYIYPNSWKNLKISQKNEDFDTKILNFKGNSLKVSEINLGGKFDESTSTTLSNFNLQKACWISENCIQCNGCSMVCPHNAISCIVMKNEDFKKLDIPHVPYQNKKGYSYAVYIDKTKCTGCNTCVLQCPAKNKALKLVETKINEKDLEISQNLVNLSNNFEFFNKNTIKGVEFGKSYFNFNTACSGCTETQYFKLISKLCGSHLVISNATGCSSIYCGSVGTCPFIKDNENLGTSFASSLFEDNAEFGLGMNLGYNINRENLKNYIEENFNNFNLEEQAILKEFLENFDNFEICKEVYEKLTKFNSLSKYLKDNLKFIMPLVHFIVGGDGFAYDIDFGGIDHIVSNNENVNILILDNEIYSNTGGQTSKSTNLGATTKYTQSKKTLKKDLFLSLMQYKNLYFAKVCIGANKNQALKAFNEAINHNGPSIILAYTPCINHGLDMKNIYNVQQNAIKSGYFNLMRYDETKKEKLILDSTPNFDLLSNFLKNENRYKYLDEQTFNELKKSKIDSFNFYLKLVKILNEDD